MASKKKVRNELKQMRAEIVMLRHELRALSKALRIERSAYPANSTYSTYRSSWTDRKW